MFVLDKFRLYRGRVKNSEGILNFYLVITFPERFRSIKGLSLKAFNILTIEFPREFDGRDKMESQLTFAINSASLSPQVFSNLQLSKTISEMIVGSRDARIFSINPKFISMFLNLIEIKEDLIFSIRIWISDASKALGDIHDYSPNPKS
jgi:hypothetical protein